MRLIEFPDVMGVRQAAAYLDVSPDALYVYAKAGTVPAFKLGNRWKFRKVRLDEWMDEMEMAARRHEVPQ